MIGSKSIANHISVFPHDFDKLPNMARQVSRVIIVLRLSFSKTYIYFKFPLSLKIFDSKC